jgi:lipopolysaccharide transport system ATP-binding protein
MSKTVIKIENLNKRYRLGEIGTGTLSHDLNRFWASIRGKEDPFSTVGEENDRSTKGKSGYVNVLNEINMEVKEGEVLGIIGKNGAGKSTLLKILSKVTGPTSGTVKYKGRIAALLEVGTGFHPELTGRENVYINGAIMGMNRKEISSRLDEIVDFAGVARYLDTPVKRYSSGMTVRLGFSIAAHLDAEILIVDEVLAVGDAEFQKKCLGKMGDISQDQRTILFVSHNMASIATLCTRCVILDNGKVTKNGSVSECLGEYQLNIESSARLVEIKNAPRPRHLSGEARILGFQLSNIEGNSKLVVSTQPCIAELVFEVLSEELSLSGEFMITDGLHKYCLFHSYLRNGKLFTLKKGVHRLICKTKPLNLYSGTYYATLSLSRPGVPVDYVENGAAIELVLPPIENSSFDFKMHPGSHNMFVDHHWSLGS